jgi:hypothetical protein
LRGTGTIPEPQLERVTAFEHEAFALQCEQPGQVTLEGQAFLQSGSVNALLAGLR